MYYDESNFNWCTKNDKFKKKYDKNQVSNTRLIRKLTKITTQ